MAEGGETDEQLARRLQREENMARWEEERRAASDAAYARALMLADQLDLGVVHDTHQPQSATHKQKQRKRNRKKNNTMTRQDPDGPQHKLDSGSPMPSDSGKRTTRKPTREGPKDEGSEPLSRMMTCLSRLMKVNVESPPQDHGEDEVEDYEPEELFEALRWALGVENASALGPPEHVENCQRLVVAWRRFHRSPPAHVRTALAELRAWTAEYQRAGQSVWAASLPQELLEAIFESLPADEPEHLLTTRLVCRYWCYTTSDMNQTFWRRLFMLHRRELLPAHKLEKEMRKETLRKQNQPSIPHQPHQSSHSALPQTDGNQMKEEEVEGDDSSGEDEAGVDHQQQRRNNIRYHHLRGAREKRRQHKRMLMKKIEEEQKRAIAQAEKAEEDKRCWKRRYYEELHGIDMSAWDEFRIKGHEHLLNGPRLGKIRPRYGISKEARLAEEHRHLPKSKARDRLIARDRRYKAHTEW